MNKKLGLDMCDLVNARLEGYLINSAIDQSNPSTKNTLFEQYKLLVDSSQKNEERRRDSNNIFIAINSICVTVLTQSIHKGTLRLENVLVLSLLLFGGIAICWDWLNLINAYRYSNYINYSVLNFLERSLPARIFSLRVDIMNELDGESEKASVILKKESLIPKLFFCIYLIIFIFLLGSLLK